MNNENVVNKIIKKDGLDLYRAASLISNNDKEARSYLEDVLDVALGHLYANSKKLSMAREFFEKECVYSLKDSIDKLESKTLLRGVYKREKLQYGMIVYLFDDGSSMQLHGFGNELKVVD